MGILKSIDETLARAVAVGEVPGVVAVAANGRHVLYESAFGKRGVDQSAEMTLDTVFWLASMTKALVATAAMQLVEQGRADLDEPVGRLLPPLASPQVLEGFDANGAPRVRPARRAITLRHLLTHTSGFSYDIWNSAIGRYMEMNDLPSLIHCRRKSLLVPLTADPGERWDYGISIDWVGQLVEAVSGKTLSAYLRDHLLDPLEMADTGFRLSESQRARLATVHQRQADGSLVAIALEVPQEPEFHMGGGGLYGAPMDYITFIQMILNEGVGPNGVRVLEPRTVALMAQNNIGDIRAGVLKSVMRSDSNDVDFFPDMVQRWGLSFLINPDPSPTGRSGGSLSWAGLANTYFWIDRAKSVGGLVMTQILPFADPAVLRLYDAFESAVYQDLAEGEGAAA